MTNKKFKVAAMSMALTACVAAQPLIANAADDVNAVSSNNTPAQTTDTSAGSGSESKGTESNGTESKGTESKSTESKGTEDSTTDKPLPAFGTDSDHVEIDYKAPKTDPEHKDITITEGDVIDTSKKDETTGETGKDIGDVKKSETDIPSSTTTKVTPSTDEKDIISKAEDGSTLVKGTEETVTKGTGKADSTTEIPDNKKNDEIDLDKELNADKGKLTWDISPTDKDGNKNTIGGYNVDKVTDSKDGDSKEITLTKSNTVTKDDMSDEDIMKLLEATTKEEKDGKTYYTKTEEIKDKDGKVIGSRTTRYEVTEKSVSSTTDTTLTIKMEKGTVESGSVDVSTEPVLPEIKETDKVGKTLLSAEELKNLLEGKEPDDKGKYVFDSDGKHYIITKTTTDGKTLTNEEVYNNLKAKGETDYTYKGGKLYYKGNELTDVQIKAIHKTLSYEVTITDVTKNPDQKDKTADEITAMEEKAKLDAIKDALTEAAKNAGVADSDEFKAALAGVSNPNAAGFITFKVNGVDYTFNYQGATVETTQSDVLPDNKVGDKEAENVKNNTVTGKAYVTEGTKSWSDSETSAAAIPMLGNNFTKLPDGVEEKDVVRETLGDTTSRIIQITDGATVYNFYYSSVDADHLTEAEKDALRQKARKAGLSEEEISALEFSGTLTSVTWKQTTTKTEIDNSAKGTEVKEKANDNQIVENTDKKGTYDITVNGKKYEGLTTSDGGKTYTKIDKTSKTTTTITVNDTALNAANADDAAKIKELLRKQYGTDMPTDCNIALVGNTATWTDKNGATVKVDYTGLLRNLSVTQTSEGGLNAGTIDQLVGEVEKKVSGLETGDQLKLTGKNGQSYTIERTAAGYVLKDGKGVSLGEALDKIADVRKELVSVITEKFVSNDTNYNMSGQDIWNLLDIQQVYGDGSADPANGKPSTDSYWPERGYENLGPSGNGRGEGIAPTTHFNSISLDAGVSFKSTDETGNEKVEKGLLLSDGLTLTYGHKEDIAGWCDLSKYPDSDSAGNPYTNKNALHTPNPKDASLSSTITTEKGYVWNNDTKSYQYTDNKLTYNYGTDKNAFDGKRFYKVSGKVAYDQQLDTSSKKAAERKRDELINAGKKQATVVAYTNKAGNTQYRVYAEVTELNAIGYMTASANTSVNQTYVTSYMSRWKPGTGTAYNGPQNAGDYSLSLQGLKLVNGKVQGNYAVNYSVGTTITKRNSGMNNILTLGQKTTTTVRTDESNEAAHSGSYSASYTCRVAGAEGTATGGTYKSFTEIIRNIFKGKGENSYDEGNFSYTYKSTDPEALQISAVSKAETTTTTAHIGYNYTTISETETIVVVPPETPDDDGDDGDDGGDDIIEDETSDSPVLPGTPELPPVQDAKPDATADAPIPPADPVLPAVQDAHALPQTGVNWLAAIGLALSGMTLMITGAFASLLGKNAKH